MPRRYLFSEPSSHWLTSLARLLNSYIIPPTKRPLVTLATNLAVAPARQVERYPLHDDVDLHAYPDQRRYDESPPVFFFFTICGGDNQTFSRVSSS